MSKFTYWHRNIKLSNKKILWSGSDNPELWESLLEKSKTNYLSQNALDDLEHYKNNPIEYKLNNYGFRTYDDFEKEQGNVFLGCSFTFGEGHHLENTWSYKLHKKIGGGLKFWNLSMGGTGIDFAFRMLYSYKNLIDVKNVFLFIPFPNRFEYPVKFSKHKQISFDVFSTPYYHVTPTFNTHEFFSNQFKDIEHREEMKNQIYALTIEEHIQMSYVKNFFAIQQVCKEIGANFYSINGVHDELRNIKEDNTLIPNMARDIHPSVSYQNTVLKLFYDSYINNKPPEMFDFSKESQLTYTKKQIEKVWFDRKTKDIL